MKEEEGGGEVEERCFWRFVRGVEEEAHRDILEFEEGGYGGRGRRLFGGSEVLWK